MQLIAKDTVLVSSVRSEPLTRGERFELEDGQAKALIERGLAEETTEDEQADGEKVAPPAKDKVERGTKTKAE